MAFSLLEKLTQDVLNIACEHHWVTYAEVEIDNFIAALCRLGVHDHELASLTMSGRWYEDPALVVPA